MSPSPTLSALALTTDGFASTTYARNPVASHQMPEALGEFRGPWIESPAEDLFLIVDTEKPGEWLVRYRRNRAAGGAGDDPDRAERPTALVPLLPRRDAVVVERGPPY